MCVNADAMHRTHTRKWGSRRGNDVHNVLSLITRLASVAAARTTVVSRPALLRAELLELELTCLHLIETASCISRDQCHRPRRFIV